MKDQLITFDTAKLAKEKGLDNIQCDHVYCIGFNSIKEDRNIINEKRYRTTVHGQFHLALAPTQSLLQKWLREKNDIEVNTLLVTDLETGYKYYMHLVNQEPNQIRYKKYEEALEKGLQEALKLIN